MAKPQMKEFLYHNIKNGTGDQAKLKVSNCFKVLQNTIKNDHKSELNSIFTMNLNNPALFPNELRGKQRFTIKSYLQHWSHSFYKQWVKGLPSQTIAKPKGSPNDKDVQLIVQTCLGITPEQANREGKIHNLFMSAENIQGKLLEEYIYKHTKGHQWVWARGTVVRACDFIRLNYKNSLMQIKNRFNSENSSSKSIRNNMQHDYKITIQRWYRSPQDPTLININHQWALINQMMGITGSDTMSNDSYRQFLVNVVKHNHKIITDN